MLPTGLAGEAKTSTVEYSSLHDAIGGRVNSVDVIHLDDKTLLAHIAQNQEPALSELYDRYGRLVFSVAFRIVGDQQTAEEITLDVFTRAWERADTYDAAKSQVSTWLTRLARNRAIDMLRREQVRPEKDSIGWSEITAVPITNSANPETRTALTIQQEQVRQALTSLPDAQRETLALAYFKGMSHREIAHYLDEPLGTVKGRIRAGMKALKGMLVDV